MGGGIREPNEWVGNIQSYMHAYRIYEMKAFFFLSPFLSSPMHYWVVCPAGRGREAVTGPARGVWEDATPWGKEVFSVSSKMRCCIPGTAAKQAF